MKNSKFKKLLCVLLSVILCLSFMPITVFAANGESIKNGYYDEQGNWTEGSLKSELPEGVTSVNKTAQKVDGLDNTYNITLDVKTSKKVEQKGKSAVLCVVDLSHSMNSKPNKYSPTRLDNAKEAIINFIDEYAKNAKGSCYFGIVTFASRTEVFQEWIDISRPLIRLNAKRKVNNLQAEVSDGSINKMTGGTNLHAGLKEANDYMWQKPEVKDIANKNTIVTTDGKPTFYLTKSIETSKLNCKIAGKTWYLNWEGSGNESSEDILRETAKEADRLKNEINSKVYTIFSGDKNERTWDKLYGKSGPKTVDYLRERIASDPSMAYLAGDTEELNEKFKHITQEVVSGSDGKGFVVHDTTPDFVTVSNFAPETEQVTLTDTGFDWTLTNPTEVKEGNKTSYEYKLTYRVVLDADNPAFVEGKWYPLNGETYMDINGTKVEFPIPAAQGVKTQREVEVEYVDHEGNVKGSETIVVKSDKTIITPDDLHNIPEYPWYIVDADKDGVEIKPSDNKVTIHVDEIIDSNPLEPADHTVIIDYVDKDGNVIDSETIVIDSNKTTITPDDYDGPKDPWVIIDRNENQEIDKTTDKVVIKVVETADWDELFPGMDELQPGMIDYTGHPAIAEMTPPMIDYTGDPAMGELQPGMAELQPGLTDLQPSTPVEPGETIDGGLVNLNPSMQIIQPGMAELQPGLTDLQPSTPVEPGETIDGGLVNLNPSMQIIQPGMAELQPGLTDLQPGQHRIHVDYVDKDGNVIDSEIIDVKSDKTIITPEDLHNIPKDPWHIADADKDGVEINKDTASIEIHVDEIINSNPLEPADHTVIIDYVDKDGNVIDSETIVIDSNKTTITPDDYDGPKDPWVIIDGNENQEIDKTTDKVVIKVVETADWDDLFPGMAEIQPGLTDLQPSTPVEPGETIDGSWVNMTPAMGIIQEGEKLEPGETIDGGLVNLNPSMQIIQPGMVEMTPGMVDITNHPAMGELQPGMAEMTPGMVDITNHPAMGELQPGMAEMTPGMVDITNHPAMGELQPGMAEMTPGMVDITNHPAMGELQPGMVEMNPGMVDYTGNPAQSVEKVDSADIPQTGLIETTTATTAFGLTGMDIATTERKKKNK